MSGKESCVCADRGPVTLDYCIGAYHLTSRAIDPLISMPFAVPSYKLGGRTTRSRGGRMKLFHERPLLLSILSVFVYTKGGDLFLPVEGEYISPGCDSSPLSFYQVLKPGHLAARAHATSPSSTCKSCTLSHATALSTFVGPSFVTASSSASLLTRR